MVIGLSLFSWIDLVPFKVISCLNFLNILLLKINKLSKREIQKKIDEENFRSFFKVSKVLFDSVKLTPTLGEGTDIGETQVKNIESLLKKSAKPETQHSVN